MSSTTGVIDSSIYTITTTTDELTDEEYRKELIDAVNTAFVNAGKKLCNFEDTYKSKVRNTHEINDLLLIKHFFLESLEEKNNDLRKNNNQYRINFSYELLFQFPDEDNEYLKENNLLDDDASTNDNKLQTHLHYVKKLLTKYSPSKKIYITPARVDEHLLSIFL